MPTKEDFINYGIFKAIDWIAYLAIALVWKKRKVILKTLGVFIIKLYDKLYYLLLPYAFFLYILKRSYALLCFGTAAALAIIVKVLAFFQPMPYADLKMVLILACGIYLYWFVNSVSFDPPRQQTN